MTPRDWQKTPYAQSDAKNADAAIESLLTKYRVAEHQFTTGRGANGRRAVMSCKNVSMEAHKHDRAHRRRAEKLYGDAPDSYRYHTLVVRPPGARSDAPAQDIGIMPRHVCRGHFAEYGPEFNKGLLFGRYSGRFYVPPHLKGDKKNGVVEKDYVVCPSPPT